MAKQKNNAGQFVKTPDAEESAAASVLTHVSLTDLTETDEAYQARIKAEKVAALKSQLDAIAAGRPLGSVAYRFKTANGESGTNLKFYLDCKTHEIETGEPCNYIEPIGPATSQLASNGKGIQPLGSPNPVKKPNCPTC